MARGKKSGTTGTDSRGRRTWTGPDFGGVSTLTVCRHCEMMVAGDEAAVDAHEAECPLRRKS